MANGHGKYYHSDGGFYEGEWKNNKQEGNGIETWANEEKYVGTYKNGLKHGEGVYLWRDGSKYEGEFAYGEKEGKGIYIGVNSEKYNGEWKGGLEDGYGVMEYEDGRVYEGQFKYGKKNGKGTMKVPGEGDWEGNWVDDKEVGVFSLIVDGKVLKKVDWGNEIETPKDDLMDFADEQDKVSNSVITIEKWAEERSIAQVADNEAETN